jgi:heme-degrading monooxygenase HmoA
MVITVFKSRLRPGVEREYAALSEEMYALAASLPGFLSVTDYAGDDGERLALIAFESAETQAAWRDHPEHKRAQRLGRERFYAHYELLVCTVERHTHFPGSPGET